MANKPKKRLRKKQAKKQQTKILAANYSPKEQKRMAPAERASEAKRIARNQARKQSRAETKAYLINEGFSERFINKNRLHDKKVTSYSSSDLLQLRKQAALENSGISYQKKDLKLGWLKLQEKYPNVSIPENAWKHKPKPPKETALSSNATYTAKQALYVGAAETRSGFHLENFDHLTLDEIAAQIHDRVREAQNNPGSSADMYCVFVVDYGGKATMQAKAKAYYNRGYNLDSKHVKLDAKPYSKLTVSNSWTERDFFCMISNCINQMKNEEVTRFMSELTNYCNDNNLPFMHNLAKRG